METKKGSLGTSALEEFLDRQGVPHYSDPMPFFPEGSKYSLCGRCKKYAEMALEAESAKTLGDDR